MRKNTNKLILLGLLDALTAVFLCFTDWVGYQYEGWFVDAKESFTLWKAADFLEEVSDYVRDAPAQALAIFIYILLGLSILFMIYTAYNLYQNYNSGVPVQTVGFVVPGILSVFVILLVAIENARLDEDLFYLTAVPFLVLITAIAAGMIDRKMPNTVPDNGKDGARHPTAFPAFTPRTPSRSCPVCGAACADPKASFCSACGAKMDTKILCSSCGAELKPNMRFCSGCGTPTQLGSPDPNRKFDSKDN